MEAGPQSPREPIPPGGWTQPLSEPRQPTGALASYGSRAAAWVVDLIVVMIPGVVVIVVLVEALAGGDAGIVAWIVATIASFGVLTVLFLVYAPLTMMRGGRRRGQTLGKQLLGIRVIRENGGPVDFGTSALREAGLKILALGVASSFVPLVPFLVDYLWPLFDDDNQAVHDIVVGTLVIEA